MRVILSQFDIKNISQVEYKKHKKKNIIYWDSIENEFMLYI